MSIDLSALDYANTALAEAKEPTQEGAPIEVALDVIEEDAGQPRKAFDKAKLEELAASIKEHGVLQPITLRAADTSGRWIIRYGTRRFRAAKLAGLAAIPAFVADGNDRYAQVIENLQRDDLTTAEYAAFIQERLGEGDSKKHIAKQLGKTADFVSIHMALIDMPSAIQAAYDEEKTVSARVISTLRGLYDKQPERVAEWITQQNEITRFAVDTFAGELKGKTAKTKTAETETQKTSGADFGRPKSGEAEGDKDARPIPVAAPSDQPGTAAKPKPRDPDAIAKPLLIVELDGRAAAVLLHRRPSAAGLIRIKYEDGGEEDEVDARRCTINRLMDGTP